MVCQKSLRNFIKIGKKSDEEKRNIKKSKQQSVRNVIAMDDIEKRTLSRLTFGNDEQWHRHIKVKIKSRLSQIEAENNIEEGKLNFTTLL